MGVSMAFFFFCLSLIAMSSGFCSFSSLHSKYLQTEERKEAAFVWQVEETAPFDELLLSWNAKRPEKGDLLFLVRVKTSGWSPWMQYADWGVDGQSSFSEKHPDFSVEMFQDTLSTSKVPATGFAIKAIAQNGAGMAGLDALHVTTSDIKAFQREKNGPHPLSTVMIPAILGQSQMLLNHPRCKDMCSPTSTSTVVNFLLGKKAIDPVAFAGRVKDLGHDIYGNWALNVAEAYHHLRGRYFCRIERLSGFAALHSYLMKNLPVVVSVKGELSGAPKAYDAGHLMVVIGFQEKEQKVCCIDSAHGASEKTIVSYPLEDFLKAWGTRKHLAYVFVPIE